MLFDVFDEITQKNMTKTSLGDERLFGAVVGVVAQNYSEDMPGRLCVNIPVRDESANQLKWAKMAMPYIGSGWGCFFLPEKEDQVILIFEDGNIDKPYVIGCIPKDTDKFLKKTADENNQIKQIKTRNGSRITFHDDTDREGAKDTITISTAGDSHLISLDNEKKNITVKDKDENCLIEMATENGNIKINASEKLELTVGDSITITMNGENGKITVSAETLKAAFGKSVKLETDGTMTISGKQTNVEASSSLKLSSSGMVTAQGSPISLG